MGRHSIRTSRVLVLALVLAGVLTAAVAEGASAATPDPFATLRARIRADSAAAVHQLDRGQADSAHTAIDALIAAVRLSGDGGLTARAQLLRPALDVKVGHVDNVLPGILAAERLAIAARDTSVWIWSLRLQSMARNYHGEFDVTHRLLEQWMDLASRIGNVEYLAWGHTMLGWFAARAGDLPTARRELSWSIARFDSLHHPVGLPYSQMLLGNVYTAGGDFAAARPLYTAAMKAARATQNRKLESDMMTNLGMVEARIGDPMRAIVWYRQAIALERLNGEGAELLPNMDNMAQLSLQLGHLEEARSTVEAALAIAERGNMGSELPWQRELLADVLAASDRIPEAKALWRQVLAAGDSADVDPRALSAFGLMRVLAEHDSMDAALAVARAAIPSLSDHANVETVGQMLPYYAGMLIDRGQAAEAARLMAPLAERFEAEGDLISALPAWSQLVRAERRLGHREAAARAIDRATSVWERGRRNTANLEFREARGEGARTLMIESVAQALEGPANSPPAARARAAFESMQRFKTRTLLERVAGPAAGDSSSDAYLEPPRLTLERFQREVVAPGELFIEFASGADTSFRFAITRDSCRVSGLPGDGSLRPLVELAAELAGGAPRSGDVGDAATGAIDRIAGVLLAGLDDLARGATVVIVAPDGDLHRVPFAALTLPGEAQPLMGSHRVDRVPSATLLAWLRQRPASSGQRVLAVAGVARGSNRPSEPMVREVRTLSRRYRDVDLWLAEGLGRTRFSTDALRHYDALHFAGHSVTNDQLPWRSGIVLGSTGAGDDSLLTAGDIAAHKFDARLVVLASCSSAGGRLRSGEGVSGLASAFLIAGTPAVVATLWPVDDAATTTLMEALYAGLAKGHPVADALRQAQQQLRSAPATRHPFYWAGFVVVGDGGARLPIRTRSLPSLVLMLAVATGVLTALYAVWLGQRKAADSSPAVPPARA